MRIDILCKPESSGKGERALENVRQALSLLELEAEVHLFKDRRKMIDSRVHVSPALLVDDNVRVSGRVPEVDEIVKILVERPRFRQRLRKVA
ncbi:MAG: thioredoxin family protein [Desulfuromonadales bacterium]|nr:thioredoxin family protein [Desulfuromonadales bacterium]MDW7757805.1 thioredoxin family protein [Desulfuromonadales bacterium]